LFSRYLVAASASLTIAILFIVYYAIPYSSTAQVSSRVFFLSQLGNTLEILLSMFLVPYRTALLHSLPWYGDPFSWQVMAGGLLLLALIALAWRKRTSSLGILLGGFILLLIPTNSIFPKDQVVVEWRFYPAMVFFALLWGVAARRLYRSGTQTLFVRLGFCLLLLGYGALASWQVYEYRSIETAYRDVLKLYPESLFALNDLGNHYFRQGDYQQSEELLRRAIIIAPGNTKVRRNLHRVLEHNHPQ
ncbi:MAG: tetratricopeptide repeat protein, partial [Bdellovibrionales bacterium]|nr:tetratricopeptide repeat protein [Bdellovibrionales bacterium]